MMNRKSIIRLSHYRNVLRRMQALGFVRVVSDSLAQAIGKGASQVRRDFSSFGITGNKKGGYRIEHLLDKLDIILGKDKTYEVVIAGAGNLAQALMNYKGLEKEGIRVVAAFDIDHAKCGTEADIPVYPLEEMRGFIRRNGIRIGIIAVPEVAAQQVAGLMFSAGIKGVLNFAPIRIKAPADCVVNSVNLELELENIIYFVNLKHAK